MPRKPAPQRETAEIYLSQETANLPADAVKVRHILFSPKDDPSAAQAGEIPADDPSWGQAKLDADAAYARLKGDVDGFDALAREVSDEESALGPDGTGGVLDAYISADSGFVESFTKPILDAKPTDGQLLPPIKTEFGYHIVQVISHAPDLAEIKQRIDRRRRFRGDRPRGLGRRRGGPRRGARLGRQGPARRAAHRPRSSRRRSARPRTSSPSRKTASTCTRSWPKRCARPEGRQLEEIRSRVFGDWYQPKKDAVTIVRDEAITGGAG